MIKTRPFGTLQDGTAVTCYCLQGSNGAHADILDYGAIVQTVCVPDRNGELIDVVLGYDTASGYEEGTCYFGALVGRHANRIGGGRFTLNGETYQLACNDGPNHLHGGTNGFNQRMFTAEVDGDILRLQLVSPDGDQGYPGTLNLTVEYRFSADNALQIHYLATSDRDTVVNLTNHSYFDLSGGKNPMGQCLRIAASATTENDSHTLPTGVIAPVADTPFDFREEKPIARDVHSEDPRIATFLGFDHNYVLDKEQGIGEVAWLRSPETGITMSMATDLPGMQLYSGNFIDAPCGKGGKAFGKWTAVCLESQSFPNGMAIPHFPKPILRASETYDHTTVYRFGVESE